MKKSLNCHTYQTHLTGYINRELPPLLRRRVASHLESCETCYVAYVRQRDLTRELTQQMPLIGRAETPRLNMIWNAVQGEMARPRRSSFSRIPLRYRFATAFLVVALLLPSLGFQALHQRQMAMALPVPPTPPETIVRTSERTVEAVAVAMATAECACAVHAEATAAPEFTIPAEPNYAPNLSGTQAP